MKKIHLLASSDKKAQAYKTVLEKTFSLFPLEEAEVCIVLGGDGFMLQALHRLNELPQQNTVCLPVYGINCGTVGFLLNSVLLEDLPKIEANLESAILTDISPLIAHLTTSTGEQHRLQAINEVTLMRQSNQTCHLSVSVNAVKRLDKLVGDGLLVATPAGSTAYNYSAGGPILPLGTKAIAITPLNPYSPRRWCGAILDNSVELEITALECAKRPVYLTADCVSIQDVERVTIKEDTSIRYRLLFDPHHNLENRILNQQFQVDVLERL